MLASILTQLDLTLSIVGLNYKGERRYKSPVGGIFSIIIFLTFVGTITYHLNLFFKRTNPKYYVEKIKYFNPPNYDLSRNFTVAIFTQYNGFPLLRDDVVQISAQHYERVKRERKYTPIDIVPCRKEDFFDNELVFDALELDKALCFNLTGFSIGGSAINIEYRYVQIKFDLCKGDSCAPNIEEIMLNENPISYIYFLDTAFQTNDTHYPVKHFLNYLDLNISFENTKLSNIYFSKNQLQINDHYFFSTSSKQYKNYMIDYFRDMVSVRKKNQDEIIKIRLLSSKNSEIYKISYMQLSELLANILALINLSVLIFSSLGEYINNYFFDNDLISAMYSLKKDNQKLFVLKKEVVKAIRNEEQIKSHNTSGQIQAMQFTFSMGANVLLQKSKVGSEINASGGELLNNYIKRSDKSLSKIINGSKHSGNEKQFIVEKNFSTIETFCISLSQFFDPFRLCQRCGKLKRRYVLIKNRLFLSEDMINLYKKLQEIDILKYVLLTEEQLNLFKIIPKPTLILSKEEKSSSSQKNYTFSSIYNQRGFHYLKSNSEMFDMIKTGKIEKEWLYEIYNKPNKTPTDEKLLNIFEERLLHCKK